jgi:hypothetical protein
MNDTTGEPPMLAAVHTFYAGSGRCDGADGRKAPFG